MDGRFTVNVGMETDVSEAFELKFSEKRAIALSDR
jgi:hypothetical protein